MLTARRTRAAVRCAATATAAAALAAGLLAPAASAHDGEDHGQHAPTPTAAPAEVAQVLAQMRRSTARFHDVDAAVAAGYVPSSPCVSSPAGGMGVHYVNPALVDPAIDPASPEVLVYAPRADGSMRLVAVEHLAVGQRPQLLGMDFEDGPFPGSYALHAWVWQANPDGAFAAFNPRVSC